MGNDYYLKKAYENMLRGRKEENSNSNKPKSLNEAYRHIVSERLAFYTKEVGDAKASPEIPGLENLGIVEQPDKIKHIIGSQSVTPALDDLMRSAGKWQALDGYENSYLEPIAAAFVACGVTSNMIGEMIKKKGELSSFETFVKSQEVFDTNEKVVADLETHIQLPSSSSEEGKEEKPVDFNKLYKHVFGQKGKISDVSVGFGEIALSLFTNCIKGKVGDLDAPTLGAVEIKTDEGRVAKKSQVNLEYVSDLVEFLAKIQAKQITSSEVSKLKHSISLSIDDIKEQKDFEKVFTPAFKEELDSLVAAVGTDGFHEKYIKSVFAAKNLRDVTAAHKALYNSYRKLGFAIEENETTPPPSDIALKYIYDVNKAIKNIFAREQNLKIEKYSSTLLTNQEIKDVSKMSTYAALQHFVQTDYGFTPEQLTEGFLLLVSKQYQATAREFASFFIDFFSPSGKYAKHNRALKSGNLRVLQGLVFALQLAVYGKNLFKYALIINKSTYEGIGIDVSDISNIYDIYIANQNRLIVSVTLDDRGGSQITLR